MARISPDQTTSDAQNGAAAEKSEMAVAQPHATKSGGKRLSMIIGLVIVLGVGLPVGIHFVQYLTSHATTDDAFLTMDITQVAPQVSGTVAHVRVQDNQRVHAGDVLVELDDATYRAEVDQAQANLDAAIAQAQGAGIAVTLAQTTGNAQISQAQGGVDQVQSGITSADVDLMRASAAVDKANAAARASTSNIDTAQAAVTAAQANAQRARAAVDAAQAQVTAARANVKAADAGVTAAQSTADKAARDAERYTSLFDKGAVSKQLTEQMASTARVTQAQLESARQQAEMARAAVTAREADVQSARQQVESADAAVAQTRAQLAGAHDLAISSQADIRQAIAQRQVAVQAIRQAKAKRTQALAQLRQANTTPDQVKMSSSNRTQALAKIALARAALAKAKLELSYTRILAPTDGIVSQRTVEVGNMVPAGTPLLALVQSGNLWVVANFKETQMTKIRLGETVTIAVDSLGGEHFTGKIDSISGGTGSTFALLPPDNSTGNFTKVVQRVPVKITLDPHQRDMDRLCAGLSANVAVAIR